MPSTLRTLLSHLTDSRTFAHLATSTTVLTALALVEPRRLSPGARLAYRTAIAAATAWTTWNSMRPTDEFPVSGQLRASATIGAAGVAMGISDASEALDGKVTDAMRRTGVRHPRLVLAGATAALSVAAWWLERRFEAQSAFALDFDSDFDADELGAEEELIELPADVEALVSLMLSATDNYGAPQLRVQLASAQAQVWEGPGGPDAFWPGLGLMVDKDLPCAVPSNANFPVIGRYRALDDRTFDVYLSVQDGRLVSLSIGEASDWTDDEQLAWFEAGHGVEELPGWPSADEIELLIETPDGLRPVASN